MRVLMEPNQPINIRNKAAASVGHMAIEQESARLGVGGHGQLSDAPQEVASKHLSTHFPDFKDTEVLVM